MAYLASDTVSRTVIGRLRSTSVDCSTSAGGLPITVDEPALGETVPARTPSSVDLPDPLGPMTASDEEAATSMVTPRSATASP